MKPFLLIPLLIGLGCAMLLFCVQSYQAVHSSSSAAGIENGRLDLTNWDAAQDGPVRLDGKWEFFWNRLVDPADAAVLQPSYYAVPANWGGTLDGAKLTGHGAATYRLAVKVKPSASAVYGMKISNIRMASTVYVNGEPVGGSGSPAMSKRDYVYGNKPYTIFFQLDGDTADIVIQAANFDYPQGGIPYDIYFGSAESINSLDMKTITLNIVAVVALFMLGIYHLSVYMMRTEDKGLLYFGLYGIATALAFSCNGDRIFMHYFDLPMELFYKIYISSLFISLILMTLFLRTMCVGLIPAWFGKSVAAFIGAYVCFVLIAPFYVYSRFNMIIGVIQIAVYLTVVFMLAFSLLKGRYGSFNRRGLALFILSLCCFLVGLIDYTLYLASIVRDYYVGYLGILGFCMMIALMLAFRFSETYRKNAEMTVKLQQADKLKDEFLLNTSHEFQTPLNGVINLSHAMLEGYGGVLNASQQRNVSIILDASRRLSALVRDIMDVEKIRRDELRVQLMPVDLKTVASVVLELLAYSTAGKPIVLRNELPDGLPAVEADEDRLKQIVYNLVGNAMKFTESGSITLSAQAAKNQVTLFVEDTGIGIPEAKWELVFEAFETVQNERTGGHASTGLGLYISRKLLRLMNGDIRVDRSKPGAGTRMAVTLTAAREGTAARAEGQERLAAAAGGHYYAIAEQTDRRTDRYTVLAVDDEPSNLHVLASLFADEFNFIWAANGQDALDRLNRSSDVDLVLLDVMMPGMSGYEVCREIRRQFSLFELPVMLMTVRNSVQDISAGFEAGANDYVIKPFDLREIRARTATLLQLKRSVTEAIKARMDFLQSQIKPHFLFNSLNVILSFCRTDGARAEQLLTHLSDYLRRSFDPGNGVFVTVKDELQLVRAYVEIEKARFEERLLMQVEVEDAALHRMILPLSIQPLVENAIRHGIMKREEGGIVKLTIATEAEAVAVEVWDNGVGMAPDIPEALLRDSDAAPPPGKRGVGLVNIHRRLIHFFGRGLRISSSQGEWTKVEFRIEKRNGSC